MSCPETGGLPHGKGRHDGAQVRTGVQELLRGEAAPGVPGDAGASVTQSDAASPERRCQLMVSDRMRLEAAEEKYAELTDGRELLAQHGDSAQFLFYDGETATGYGRAADVAERHVRFVQRQAQQ